MVNSIPLSVPCLRGNEQKYVADAIAQEWVSTAGGYVAAFEERFAAYVGADMAVSCQSGTAALHLALLECGVQQGDLVIAPVLTFIASINPIRYVGADPVFMDCDDSLCMDMDKLGAYLDRECEHRSDGILYDKALGRPVKAVMVVHVFGNGADMEALMRVARAYGLKVIEDAAEAAGTKYVRGEYAGRMAGTIGDFGAYSFNGNKIMTTGGGGMLVAADKGKLAHAKHLSTQAKTDGLYYFHDAVGYNYRMTNLQAALGVAQLEQIETFIATKKANYEHYLERGVTLLPWRDEVRPNYWFYSHPARDRDGLLRYLEGRHIQTRPIWALNHAHPMYAACRRYALEKAPAYYAAVLNIPCSSNLTREGVESVAAAIQEYEDVATAKI